MDFYNREGHEGCEERQRIVGSLLRALRGYIKWFHVIQ